MIRIKFGNLKLGDDTAIFNITSATDCPAKKLNLCDVVKDGILCYAYKAEKLYKNVMEYRLHQQHYWRSNKPEQIALDIIEKCKRRKKKTKYFRFNESGDFIDQSDINKMSEVAEILKSKGIVTYGYTARSDLNFSNINFLVKGSGWNGPNGKTIIIKKQDSVPKGYILCPGSCKKCNLCKINNPLNIAFRKH